MPQLTKEDLAKIYPRAKSYDELQAERELRDAARRPTFVAARIALWVSLFVPTITVAYYAALRIAAIAYPVAASGSSSSSMAVLAALCLIILLGMTCFAVLYYLKWRIDSLISKTVVATSRLYLLLAGILCIAAVSVGALFLRNYTPIVVVALPTLWVLLASFITTKRVEDFQ